MVVVACPCRHGGICQPADGCPRGFRPCGLRHRLAGHMQRVVAPRHELMHAASKLASCKLVTSFCVFCLRNLHRFPRQCTSFTYSPQCGMVVWCSASCTWHTRIVSHCFLVFYLSLQSTTCTHTLASIHPCRCDANSLVGLAVYCVDMLAWGWERFEPSCQYDVMTHRRADRQESAMVSHTSCLSR